MSDLFPEYLKEYLNPEKIDFIDSETKGAGYILPNGLIFLNSNDTLEDQILALLHEVIHMHPTFVSYTGGLWNGFPREENMEVLIEEHARQLYKKRPDIVKCTNDTLEQAQAHYLNSSEFASRPFVAISRSS